MGNGEFIFHNQKSRDPSPALTGAIQEVELVVGNGCDWGRCDHCFFPEHGQLRPLDETLAIAERLQAQGLSVIPAFGEVLATPEYLAVYRALGRKYLLTNGLVLASRKGHAVAEQIKQAGLEQVGFTLNEDSCNHIGGVGQKVVTRAVQTTKEAGLVPTATAVITSQNFDHVPQIVALAKQIGFRALKFNRLIPTKPQMVPLTPSPSETAAFFSHLEQQRNLAPKSEIALYASGLFGLRGRGKDLPTGDHFCLAGRQMVTIGLDDKVYPCLLLMDAQYQIGSFAPLTGEIALRNSGFSDGQYGQRECVAYELLYLNQRI
jgi:MoaA/NifB/PqqE/SkfB family radical SAM enzyme